MVLKLQEYIALIQQCTRTRCLSQGKHLHSELVKAGYVENRLIGNALIQMYGVCECVVMAQDIFEGITGRNVFSWTILVFAAYGQNGHLREAEALFEKIPARNVTTWNSLISAYNHNGCHHEALKAYHTMCLSGEVPDHVTFVSLIDSCAELESLSKGTSLHDNVIEAGFIKDHTMRHLPDIGNLEELKGSGVQETESVILYNALINMYGRSGCVARAWKLFSGMQETDVISWTSMITALAQNGQFDKAIELLDSMPVCKNLVSWTAIITAAVKNDRRDEAFRLLQKMDLEGTKPDALIFVTVLQGCESLHVCDAIDSASAHEADLLDVIVFNSVVAAYGRCKSLLNAKRVFDRGISNRNSVSWNCIATVFFQNGELEQTRLCFDRMPERDLVSWNIMLSAYAQNGQGSKALHLFLTMNLNGIKPDRATFINLIDACSSSSGTLPHSIWLQHILSSSHPWNDLRLRNATINMFGRRGAVELAIQTFNTLEFRNDESWAQVVACCAQNGDPKTGILLFRQMDLEGARPTELAYLGALSACSETSSLSDGAAIHSCLAEDTRTNLIGSPEIRNALISMYERCGCAKRASFIFSSLPSGADQTVTAWTSVLANTRAPMELYREMLLDGVQPTDVTITVVLSACSRLGLLEEGVGLFRWMLEDYGMSRGYDQYSCLVDMLGRAGRVDDAEELVESMPFEGDVNVWMSVVSSSCVQGEADVSMRAARHAVEVGSGRSSPYVMLGFALKKCIL